MLFVCRACTLKVGQTFSNQSYQSPEHVKTRLSVTSRVHQLDFHRQRSSIPSALSSDSHAFHPGPIRRRTEFLSFQLTFAHQHASTQSYKCARHSDFRATSYQLAATSTSSRIEPQATKVTTTRPKQKPHFKHLSRLDKSPLRSRLHNPFWVLQGPPLVTLTMLHPTFGICQTFLNPSKAVAANQNAALTMSLPAQKAAVASDRASYLRPWDLGRKQYALEPNRAKSSREKPPHHRPCQVVREDGSPSSDVSFPSLLSSPFSFSSGSSGPETQSRSNFITFRTFRNRNMSSRNLGTMLQSRPRTILPWAKSKRTTSIPIKLR